MQKYYQARSFVDHLPKGLIATLLISSLFSVLFFPAVIHADEEVTKTNQELKQLRHRIDLLRQAVNQTRNRYDQERSKLRDIDLRISKHVKELKYIHFRLGQQDRRLGQLYHDRKRYKKELAVQRELLAKQVRTSYIMGQQAYIKLILSQDEPAAVGRTLKYYDYFHQQRSALIKTATTAIGRFEQNKRDIEQEKLRLADLRKYSQKKKHQLEQDSQQRSQMVASLNQQLQGKTSTLNRMLEDEKQLQKLLSGIERVMPEITGLKQQNQAFAKLRGKLTWPTAGRIQRLFGSRRGTSKATWNGVMIRTSKGKDVHAISHGRVAYADWLRGYGLLLIIDHGHGYMSLYGHNQSLLKETGDWVEAGEAIASVGNSAGHADTGLYFEIRHKGKPRNPVNWCRKQRRS
ncbi:MAG: peptidoglycan DD-metalloendopeptidase family protein [Gammaproteobacteria bacterium]|nr:peptidoglycan DD-metalloendopeptidase family protein [Gammaproteobacteria bacterium]